MKLDDYEFRNVNPELGEFKDDLLTVVNFGKLPFQVVSEVPTWTAENGESVFYQNGVDKRWYFYTGGAWRSFSFNNQIVNAWVTFSGTGAISIKESYNVRSITDNGRGDYTLNFDKPFSSSNYAVVGLVYESTGAGPENFVLNINSSANSMSNTACRIGVRGFASSSPDDLPLVTSIFVGNV